MRILVADDSEQDRYLLRRIFELNGFDVDTAANGEEALKVAIETPPDLVISDIMMPVKDGFQLCRDLRENPALESIPFVFYSAAYTSEADREFARNVGATRFLEKPQNPKALIEVVKEILHDESLDSGAGKSEERMEETTFIKEYSTRIVRKLEEKVQEQQETQIFLQAVLDSMIDGLVIMDRNLRVVDANYAAGTLLNLSKEEIVGRTCHDLFHGLSHPCGAATAPCPFKTVFEGGETVKLSYDHFVPTEGKTFEVTASPVRDKEGDVILMLEILRDVTERTKLEEELNSRVKELEDYYDASVSKELRAIETQKENERLKQRLRELGELPE